MSRLIDIANPAERGLLKSTLLHKGQPPTMPDAGEPVFVKTPSGFIEGEGTYLIASLRYLLFQALSELDKRKVGMS